MERTALIKSNSPHLTGGENIDDEQSHLARALMLAKSKGLRFRSGAGVFWATSDHPCGWSSPTKIAVSVQGIPRDWDRECPPPCRLAGEKIFSNEHVIVGIVAFGVLSSLPPSVNYFLQDKR